MSNLKNILRCRGADRPGRLRCIILMRLWACPRLRSADDELQPYNCRRPRAYSSIATGITETTTRRASMSVPVALEIRIRMAELGTPSRISSSRTVLPRKSAV
jgi:hypothetical protein